MSSRLYKNLPLSPGVYIMKDAAGRILYVGKAKQLRKRVASYFRKNKSLTADKRLMVPLVKEIDHIVTDTELEALLLETNLIKKHRPKYNIRLKDDKNYQYIKIDYSWDFPKIYTVHRIEDTSRNAQYFGPFTDGWAVKQSVELMRKLFRYRTCNREIPYDLTKLYSRPCLNHHINLCLGPCIGATDKTEYDNTIHKCVQFLQGKQDNIIKELRAEMKKESIRKNFEKAARLRDQINDLEQLSARQKMISAKDENLDIVSFFKKNLIAAFNVFLIRQGKLIGKENFRVEFSSDDKDADIMSSFLELYYATTKNRPQQIYLQTDISQHKFTKQLLNELLGKKRGVVVPQRGKFKKLIALGRQNAHEYWDKQRALAEIEPEKAVAKLQKILGLTKPPRRIEAYDISNLQGTSATGSMVVFGAGRSQKSEYRKFKIRTKSTPDDVAMIREVLTRRFADRNHEWPRPDLILIDGGKPQLNAAQRSLAARRQDIPIISLAKRKEEIFVPGRNKSLQLDKDDPALHLLQQLRDEAHRFAITYHSKVYKNKTVTSKLDQVTGIGPATRKKLLLKFGSVAGIKKAARKELEKVVGPKKTDNLLEQL